MARSTPDWIRAARDADEMKRFRVSLRYAKKLPDMVAPQHKEAAQRLVDLMQELYRVLKADGFGDAKQALALHQHALRLERDRA